MDEVRQKIELIQNEAIKIVKNVKRKDKNYKINKDYLQKYKEKK